MQTTITLSSESLLERAKQVFSTLDIKEETRSDYEKSVKAFVQYISLNPMTNNTFLEFKQYLALRKDIGVSCKNKYLISARVLLRELARTGSMADITHNVKGFKQGRRHKRDGLNMGEINKLMIAIRAIPDNFTGLRFKAIISLLLYQGLRQKEIIGLDISHIDFNHSRARITGKGRDDFEIINLHPLTIAVLKKYIAICGAKDGALFFGRGSKRLCCYSIRRLVTNQLLSLSIFKTTHGFRHFFVTTMIKALKGNLLEVAKMSRHSGLDMLQVYDDELSTANSLPMYYDAFQDIRISV